MQRRTSRRSTITVLLLAVFSSFAASPLLAQSRTASESPSQKKQLTQVSFELLIATRVPPLAAQQWGEIFRRAGADVRIRQARSSDRAAITESKRGSVRLVKATGLLNQDGSVLFENRRFQQSQTALLADWIRELKTYGAQGSDAGKPGFGLTREQFDQVFRILAGEVVRDPAGLELPAALATVSFPTSLPLRITPAAEELLKRSGAKRPAPEGLAGLSRGTVLAILLNEEGLGFRPGRTPEGSLELRVSPLDETESAWPIGWPLERPPVASMPKFVEAVPIEFDDVPLIDVIHAISVQTGISILTDHRRAIEANIQLSELKVNQEYRKMTWSGLLDRVTFPHLMRELLQDEAGTPFVFVTTRTVTQMNERARQVERLLDQKAK
ncbi:MAG: hypothetical protein HQ518_16145 [Rhodopirellula sp.]|nr:hypothetical protein [Rhodopirellula sp.]